MKKLLAIAALVVAAYGVQAQGNFTFSNRVTASQVDVPVFDVGGVNRLDSSMGNFVAQLYWAAGSGAAESTLNAVTDPAAPFRAPGAGAGFWNAAANSPDNNRVVGVAVGANVSLQVRVWNTTDGATFALASVKPGAKVGKSNIITVAAGDPGVAPATPTPALMNGLNSFTLTTVVPEPSTIALSLLGAGALLLRRRK
jgi:hypothetical protein